MRTLLVLSVAPAVAAAAPVAAGARFDRFLSFGVNLGQFTARQWYRIPAPAATAIRRPAARLAPTHLPHDILQRSR